MEKELSIKRIRSDQESLKVVNFQTFAINEGSNMNSPHPKIPNKMG